MADKGIRPDLIKKLQEIAQRENRSINELLEEMIARYEATMKSNPMLKIALAAEREGWSSVQTDVSERSREILNNEFADYLLARLNRPENQQDE